MSETLESVLSSAWAMLRRGVADRRHGFHTPAIATVGGDGLSPDVRTVVLRGVDEGARSVRCHTDRRSPKVAALRARPSAAWLFYDRASKVQIRAVGKVDVITQGEEFERAWMSSRMSSRRCYLAPVGPSSVVDGPTPNLPAWLLDRDPTDEESEIGRDYFAVVRCVVDRLDWLHLARGGHLRAGFGWSGDGAVVTKGDKWFGEAAGGLGKKIGGGWVGVWLTP